MPTAEEARAELARRELARRAAARVAANGGTLAEQGWAATRAYQDVSPPRPTRTAPRAAPPRRVGTGEDVARSGLSGFTEGLQGMQDSLVGAPAALARSQREAALADLRAKGYEAPEWFTGLTRFTDDPFGGVRWKPQTGAGEWSRTAGMMLPNALSPGSGAARAAAVVLPTVGARVAGDTVEALGGDENAQGVAEAVGGIVGGLGAGVRRRPGPPRIPSGKRELSTSGRALRMATRGLKPEKLEEAASRLRAAGVEPALVDVTDDAGRALIRAAAERGPARQTAEDFADARVTGLPDRMSGAARRIMSPDPRTPDEIAKALSDARRAAGDAAYGAVRGESVPMPRRTADALRTDYGRSAIREAAKRELDPEVRAALMRLADDALDRPNTEITVGMADRISRALRGQARAAGGDNDLARVLHSLADDVQAPMQDAVPGYAAAVDEYAAGSRAIERAQRGEDFLARNTDEFVASLRGATPDELALARATARRAIERQAGENVSAAPGVARRLALAPEQQARNRALLGEDDARRLQDAMAAEERLAANARYIRPGTGSQTFSRTQGAADVAGNVAEAGLNVASGGKLGLLRAGLNALRSRGLSENDAAMLLEAATDPARLNGIIADMARRNPQLAADTWQMLTRAGVASAVITGSEARRRPAPPRR